MQKVKLIISLLLLCGVLAAQSNYESEKIFVHTDRDFYAAGDTIWLKSYIFEANTHDLSQKSKVLYLLLQNQHNKIICQSKVAIQAGHATSQFILPKSLTSGQYELTAFTNVMRNFSSTGFYTKKIKIVTAVIAPPYSLAKKTMAKQEVLFFPEGGTLIDGISSKIAIKLNNFPNLIKGFEGKIVDSTGKLVTTFYPDIQKIGTFVLKPETGMKYYATFVLAGKAYKEALPLSQLTGYVLNTDNVVFSDGLLINVYTNVNEPSKFNIVARQRGIEILKVPFETVNTNFKFVLNNELVPNSGVVEVALEDLSGNTVCKRLVYFLNNSKNSLSIKNYKPNLTPKGKVDFDLYVLDDNQRPISGLDLSVAVTDITAPGSYNPKIEVMQNTLVFDADFDTEIQKLDSLFEFQPTVSKYYLDNLMLTMDWKKEKVATSFDVERNLVMRGSISENGVSVQNQKLKIYLWDKVSMKYLETKTDSNGDFILFGDWADSVKVLASNELGVFVNLKLDGFFSPKVENVPMKISTLTNTNHSLMPNQIGSKPALKSNPNLATKTLALKEVVVTGQKSRDFKNDYRRRTYNWEADFETSVKVDSSSEIVTIVDLIENKLPELLGKIDGGDENWVMLDGVRVPVGFLYLIKPQDIVWLDFLKTKERTSKLGQERGVIVNLLTDKGKDLSSIFKLNNYQTYIGYTKSKGFYSPIYTKSTAKVDRRKTLYWNPLQKTDIYGKTKVEFYNGSLTKRYLVTVYGTDGNGRTISERMILK